MSITEDKTLETRGTDTSEFQIEPEVFEQIEKTPAPGEYPPLPKKTVSNKKKRKKVVKLVIGLSVLGLVLAGIIGGMYWLFSREKGVHYATEQVYTGMLETAVQGLGAIKPMESADIAVQNKGRVKEIFFFEGDMVVEGDLLFTMDSEELDKEIEVLHQKIDEVQKKIDKVNEEINDLQGSEAERIANLTVKAPFKGQLIEAEAFKPGDQVSVGQKVGLLVDNAGLKLSLYFSYAYENSIKVGQTADISIPATMSVVGGTVEKINKIRRVSPEGATLFEVVIALRNPGALTADMEASAVIKSGGEDIYPFESGKLEYGRSEELQIKAPGKITYANVIDYMEYSSGTVLCRIEYKEDNEATQSLQQTIKAYEEEIQTLEEELADKEEGYKNLNVTAPMDGTIMYNNLIQGEMAEPGMAVISIAKLDKMIVDAQVDEREVGNVRPGMPVEITIWMMDGQMVLPGTVKSVSMSAENNDMGGMSYFPAVFEIENFSGILMSGMGVDYRLIVEQKFDILVAPVIAVKNTEQGTCVFVRSDIRPENAIDLEAGIVPPGFFAVPVECGIGNENGIEILSGISDGTEVFTQIIPLDEMQDDMYGGGGGMVFYG